MSDSLITTVHVRVVTGAGGGPDKTILRSPRYMSERGFNELCVYLRPPGDRGFAALEEQAAAAAAELIAFDDRGPLDLSVVRRLIDLCRRRHVALWHGHDYKSNLLGMIVARFVPLRLVSTVHGWVHHTRRTPLYYWIDRRCLRWYERVVCVSQDLLDACVASGVNASRCELLENAIECDRYERRYSPAEARAPLGLPAAVPLVGAIGRLAHEKGFDVLLRALAALKSSGTTFQAVILGEGPERAALERQISGAGLADCVRLLGQRDDVARWLEAMDLFVLSSRREALPNVLLEALAMQTPVVATRIAGVPGVVVHQQSALLVPPEDTASLRDAIAVALADSALRDRLSRAGRTVVEARYDFARRMDRMRDIYSAVLDLQPDRRLSQAS